MPTMQRDLDGSTPPRPQTNSSLAAESKGRSNGSLAVEYSATCIEKRRGRPRGKSQKSLDLINEAYRILAEEQPTTVRRVCYVLFSNGWIKTMKPAGTGPISKLLVYAREQGIIPWEWIVDNKRNRERAPQWRDPDAFVRSVRRSYRRDFWAQQPHRVELWSEKDALRSVLGPVLDEYGAVFFPVGGFNSASKVREVAKDNDGRPIIALYAGDRDPSGMHMSEVDLPRRIARYGGDHVILRRIALLPAHAAGLRSFPAGDKRKDPRYNWYVQRYGDRCWEVDAMNSNALRDLVREEIEALIEPEAWERCYRAQEAEQESLQSLLDKWKAA